MGGGTPSRSRTDCFGGGIPWVKTTDLNNGLILKTEETLTPLGLAESSCTLIPAGSVLVAMYGGLRQIGRTGLLLQESTVNQALTAIVPNPTRLVSAFLLEWLNFHRAYWRRFAASSRKDPNITKGDVEDFPVPLVPIEQQAEVVRALQLWNTAIAETEKLIAAREQYLSYLRSHLLQTPDGAARMRLRAVTRELAARNGVRLGHDSVMGVTNRVGMRPMREETIAENIERYKVVPPRAFAYNPMRLNVGSIAMSLFDVDVLVSPDYVVFECDESQLIPGYLNHLCRSRLWKRLFDTAGSGSVRVRIYYDDLGGLTFDLPPVEVQAGIVYVLDAAGEQLELLRLQNAALSTQKRGLMQKLLSGRWTLPVASDGTVKKGK